MQWLLTSNIHKQRLLKGRSSQRNEAAGVGGLDRVRHPKVEHIKTQQNFWPFQLNSTSGLYRHQWIRHCSTNSLHHAKMASVFSASLRFKCSPCPPVLRVNVLYVVCYVCFKVKGTFNRYGGSNPVPILTHLNLQNFGAPLLHFHPKSAHQRGKRSLTTVCSLKGDQLTNESI